ncbi:hypothetical protein [Altericista sp. CCNU0014]|uniref:hypothetical protein n=1 Tax=Altericista sp. CCNU0014 TaxID=3082949 RepID=UPI00384E5C41
MSQQSPDSQEYSSSSWLLKIRNSFQNWISKEIIDFDPFDCEALVTQQILDQLHQNQANVPECQLKVF